MEIDTPKGCRLVQMREAVTREDLRNGVRVRVLPGQFEAGHDSCVLIQARAFRQTAERAFDLTDARLKLQVRQALLVHAGDGEQASVASALQGEDVRVHEAGNWNDAAGRSGLRKPRRVFQLFSICAGHSRTSG